jgi:sugar phosphate isomerase/epimerase
MPTEDLVAACWTTAGDAAPLRGDEISPNSLLDRVKAASDAGFRGMGLLHADLVVAREKHGFAEMRTIFEDHGLVHLEFEFLGNWWTDGEARASSDAVRRDLLEAAEALGARQIKIGADFSHESYDVDHWAGEFAALAAEAEGAGTRIALEFLPMTRIANLQDGLRIVEGAGHRAGGLLIDLWHVARAGTSLSEVAAVPVDLIVGVELDDADAEPAGTLWEDTIDNRKLCGEGDLDVVGFISTLRSIGWTGPWGVEILAEDYRKRPIHDAVADAYDTAIAQFALADKAGPGRPADAQRA